MKKNYALKSAFSLMEMMIVLLIVAIIVAATAPMVSKKMLMSATSGDSPWVFANTNGTIAYNMGARDMSAIIGASSYNANGGPTNPRLVLSAGTSDANHPALVFATGKDGTYRGQINMTENTVTMNGGTGSVGTNSVAMGMNQKHNKKIGTVAIGNGAEVTEAGAISIGMGSSSGIGSITISGRDNIPGGTKTSAEATNAIAIGNAVSATGNDAIAIGSRSQDGPGQPTNPALYRSTTASTRGVAIGTAASASGVNSIALGASASASELNSVAIGCAAVANREKQITLGRTDYSVLIPGSLQTDGLTSTSGNGSGTLYVNYSNNTQELRLGTSNDTVYIPGNLVVDGDVLLAGTKGHSVWLREYATRYNNLTQYCYTDDGDMIGRDGLTSVTVGNITRTNSSTSDRRLKNVGKNFTAGLNELKKLDFYHYTFKNDKDKTPQVGVMAQDLQKVFPTSVTSDQTGYLRIRWDEMFYAVINAVKELDTRITALTQDVKSYFDKTTKLEETVKAQQKTIEELEQRIAKLENK